MQEQYGKFKLVYNEGRAEFVAYDEHDDEVSRSAKLSDLKKRLDRIGKVRKEFKRFTILSVYSGGSDSAPRIFEHEVTSIVDRRRELVWLSTKDGKDTKRAQAKICEVRWGERYYPDTPEVRASLADAVRLYNQAREIEATAAKQLAAIPSPNLPADAEEEAS
jgi:hypothetical protein